MISSGSAISEDRLDRVFQALSDRTRRALVRSLSDSPETVTELAEPFDMSLNAISKHLMVLENAGLIARHKSGRTNICSLKPDSLHDVRAWLDHYTEFWNANLDSFQSHMKKAAQTAEDPSKVKK